MIARTATWLLVRGMLPVDGDPHRPGSPGRSGYWQCLPPAARAAYRGVVSRTDLNAEIREFLSTRRARITPEQAGLPAYGQPPGQGAAPRGGGDARRGLGRL